MVIAIRLFKPFLRIGRMCNAIFEIGKDSYAISEKSYNPAISCDYHDPIGTSAHLDHPRAIRNTFLMHLDT